MYQFAVYVHILSVICWLGSAVVIAVAIAPALRKPETREAARTILAASAGRLKVLAWVSLGLIVLTGGYLIHVRFGGAIAHSDFWSSSMGHLLGMKLAGITTILALSAWHDFVSGPRAVRLMRESPDGAATRRSRLAARVIGMVNLLIGLILVLCGVFLVRPPG